MKSEFSVRVPAAKHSFLHTVQVWRPRGLLWGGPPFISWRPHHVHCFRTSEKRIRSFEKKILCLIGWKQPFSLIWWSHQIKEQCPLVYGKLQITRGWGLRLLLSHNHVKRTLCHARMCVESILGKSNQCYLMAFLNDLHFCKLHNISYISGFYCLTGRNNAQIRLGLGLSI